MLIEETTVLQILSNVIGDQCLLKRLNRQIFCGMSPNTRADQLFI